MIEKGMQKKDIYTNGLNALHLRDRYTNALH